MVDDVTSAMREEMELAFLNLWLRYRQIESMLRSFLPKGPPRSDPFASRRTTLPAVRRGA